MPNGKKYYREGVDTARKIVALMEGNEGDSTGLEETLNTPEYESLVDTLSDGEKIRRTLEGFDRPEAHNEAARFKKHILRRRVRSRLAGISVAAAVIAAAIAIVWFVGSDGGIDDNIVARVESDVTLTLPDGSEIVLDRSTDNGRVAEQGNVTFSRENGVLIQEKQRQGAQASDESNWGSVAVPRGARFDMVLEDGTKVWVNANSRLRFPVEFSQGERRVRLEGEAYFEVTPDASRPFFVETRDQTLKVLGTEFNVYAYPEEPSVLTTLVDGSISLRANGVEVETVLEPGQQAQLQAGSATYTVAEVDAEEIASWRSGMFIFNDNKLETVLNKLSRWYDFEYHFEDPQTKDIIVMGNIPVDFEFDEVLNLINDSKVAEIRRKGNLVTIRAKK